MSPVRWEVFKQDSEDKPHQAVGSVHAADADGALLNARHVFARRPAAISLWVVEATAIYSWTAEELIDVKAAAAKYEPTSGRLDATATNYLVFRKTSNRRSMTFVDHCGGVVAESPAAALKAALERYREVAVLAWWLVPDESLRASAAEDAASWFDPAREKTYKQQSAYGRVTPTGSQERRTR